MIAYPSEEIATSALEQGTISGYYVIHADYLKTGQLDLFFDQFNLNTLSATGLRTALAEALVAKTGQNVDPQVITRLGSAVPPLPITSSAILGDTQNQHEGAALILVYVFVLFLMFSTFGTSAYLMQSVVEEKENRMVEILLSSLRPRELLAGKFIALSLLGLVQTVAWGAAILIILTQLGTVIPGVTITISTNQLIVLGIFFILGYLLFPLPMPQWGRW
ncbi:MAG: ABC transporter permease [Anaerolineales bacterium]|nr:ABC transporter permease [Anaerolineales bacterium]